MKDRSLLALALTLVLLALLTTSSSSSSSSSSPAFSSPSAEFLALHSFFTHTNGPTSWLSRCSANWNFTCLEEGDGALCPDPCDPMKSFNGITCFGPNVSSIFLPRCHMSGTLPEEALNELGWLAILELTENNISGTLPAITKPIRLLQFQIGYNKLTGPIPALHPSLLVAFFKSNYLTGK